MRRFSFKAKKIVKWLVLGFMKDEINRRIPNNSISKISPALRGLYTTNEDYVWNVFMSEVFDLTEDDDIELIVFNDPDGCMMAVNGVGF